MSPRFKQLLKLSLRALLGFGLLAFVIIRMDISELIDELVDLSWWPLAMAVLAQLMAKIVWTFRWKEILKACGLERRLRELLALLFIGLFFNNFLPTAMGGDLVRGYYVARGKENVLTSYVVLLIERTLGLITLASLAAGASMVILVSGSSSVPRDFLVSIAILGAAVTGLGVITFYCRGWILHLGNLPWLSRKTLRLTADFSRALNLFQRSDTNRFWIIANSMALQVVAVLFYVACARSVGLKTPAAVFFLVVPGSVIAAMLPISLNGIGVREGVLVGLLVACGAPSVQSSAFAILALLVSTFFALIGGVVSLAYRLPIVEETACTDSHLKT